MADGPYREGKLPEAQFKEHTHWMLWFALFMVAAEAMPTCGGHADAVDRRLDRLEHSCKCGP